MITIIMVHIKACKKVLSPIEVDRLFRVKFPFKWDAVKSPVPLANLVENLQHLAKQAPKLLRYEQEEADRVMLRVEWW
jgi:hypothetical protein